MADTKIEWATAVWNPVTGCTPISPACDHCYAERMSHRLAGRCGYPADEPFRVTLHPDKLDEPLKWRKPRRVFVCSMGDLFHEEVPEWYITKVWDIMSCFANRHTFLVLTKRPERMRALLTRWSSGSDCYQDSAGLWQENFLPIDAGIPNRWPLPNVWLGVTAENQEQADARIPVLLDAPAAGRFVSCEPLLGPVDLSRVQLPDEYDLSVSAHAYINVLTDHDDEHYYNDHAKLHWVIAGCESGPGRRHTPEAWISALRDECAAAAVPFFCKQMEQNGQLVKMPVLDDDRVWAEIPEALR